MTSLLAIAAFLAMAYLSGRELLRRRRAARRPVELLDADLRVAHQRGEVVVNPARYVLLSEEMITEFAGHQGLSLVRTTTRRVQGGVIVRMYFAPAAPVPSGGPDGAG